MSELTISSSQIDSIKDILYLYEFIYDIESEKFKSTEDLLSSFHFSILVKSELNYKIICPEDLDTSYFDDSLKTTDNYRKFGFDYRRNCNYSFIQLEEISDPVYMYKLRVNGSIFVHSNNPPPELNYPKVKLLINTFSPKSSTENINYEI